MPILTFRVALEEDTSIFRDIDLKHNNSFQDFYKIILEAFNFDDKFVGVFYTSNANWRKLKGIRTDVKVNKSDAEFLSAKKTSISALVVSPDQRFLFFYDLPKKMWQFEIEMINISKDEDKGGRFPVIILSEGISPSQYGLPEINTAEVMNENTEAFDETEDSGLDISEVSDDDESFSASEDEL